MSNAPDTWLPYEVVQLITCGTQVNGHVWASTRQFCPNVTQRIGYISETVTSCRIKSAITTCAKTGRPARQSAVMDIVACVKRGFKVHTATGSRQTTCAPIIIVATAPPASHTSSSTNASVPPLNSRELTARPN